MKKLILFISTFIIFTWQLSATHYLGVDIWIEQNSLDTVEVFLSRYLDCNGGATQAYLPIPANGSGLPAPFSIEFGEIDANNCMVPHAPWSLDSWADLTPLCPSLVSSCTGLGSGLGIVNMVHSRKYIINPNCFSWSPLGFYFENCCRSNSITSIVNPGQNDTYVETRFSIYPQNQSPKFLPSPDLVICSSQQTIVSLAGIDPDGDSLDYQLVPCSQTASTTVTYGTGYSALSPLGPSWNVTLDSITGDITFNPTPGGLETGPICIVVKEYRNGVFISESNRDLSFQVVDCGMNVSPSTSGFKNVSGGLPSGTDTINYCPGLPLQFEIDFTDPDTSQIISVSNNLSSSLPGASISSTGQNPVIVSVDWIPPLAFSDSLELTFEVVDGACPLEGKLSKTLVLYPNGPCFGTSISNASCIDSSGSIAMIVSGDPGPLSYTWSTGSTDSILNMIPIGTYWISITDSNLTPLYSDTFLVSANDILISDSIISPTCNAPGEITLQTTGGISPYSYLWSTGDTSNSISGLDPGGYSVIIIDSVECFRQEVYLLTAPDSCFVILSGYVFQDVNGNCIKDPSDSPLGGMLINGSQGGFTMSDSAGFYEIKLDTGMATLSLFSGQYPNSLCDTSFIWYANQYGIDSTGFDFAINTLSYQDLGANITATPAVWNGDVSFTITVKNLGTTPVSGAIKTLTYPAGLSLISTSVPPVSIDTINHTIAWAIGTLFPTQSSMCVAQFSLGSSVALGQKISTEAKVITISLDSDTTNDTSVANQTVVGSYDPNDKQVSPAGIDSAGFILQSTSTLDYTIRFQNTGNFPATFVVLRDTLSPFLDLTQYNTLGFSHPFALTVEEDSIMVFTFANINLPDSMSDPLGSQGFVEFQLGLEAGLPVGTTIENSAAIYFDFNPPIFTNTVLNTIYTQLDVELTEDSLYCIGDPIFANLITTGKPPYSFDWNFGGPSTTNDTSDVTLIFQTGWYVVTVTDAFGFSDTDSVLVIPEPGIFADFEWELTGNGFEVAFTDSSKNGVSYFWDFGNGDTSTLQNPVVVYPQPGEYIVKFGVTNICGADTSTQTIRINNDAIDTWPFGPVSVQPNPFTHSTNILFPLAGTWEVKLYDLRGKMVYREVVSGSSATIERESLSDGIYYLEVSDGEHSDRRKVLITD